MPDFEQTLRETISQAPAIDPHSHLRPDRPQAQTLADLVLYHHVWIELVSAGMPAEATSAAGLPHEVTDPGLPPLARARAALPYLPRLRNTTLGYLLRTLLEDLYGVPGGELTADNLEAVAAQVEQAAAEPGRGVHVLQERCNLRRTITVEGSRVEAVAAVIGRGREGVPINLLSGKQTSREMIDTFGKVLHSELQTAQEYGAAMHRLGAERAASGLQFIGIWVPPALTFPPPTLREIQAVLTRAHGNKALSPQEGGVFAGFGLRHFLEGMREGPLRTVQVIVGAEVLPPHRAVTQWSPEFPAGLSRLAGAFEDFHFNCSTASDLYTQDLGILAKHIPNISVAGYWWHTLYPHYIKKSLETRLDMVPANKIIAYFSDAYHAEWCYPKLKLVKQLLGDVLLERVQRGWYSEEIALSLVAPLLHENAASIYGC